MASSAAGDTQAVIAVLDASAMQALLRQEPGWEVVRNLLADPDNTCYAHAINLCEVFYDTHRDGGEQAAQLAIARLLDASVVPRADLDTDLWEQAGRHKSVYRRVSLADCLCIAFAQRVGGVVVTCDHHEFDALAPIGLCPILFIR